MKKVGFVGILIGVVLFLAGCGSGSKTESAPQKELSVEEATHLLIKAYVYGDDIDEFRQYYPDASDILKVSQGTPEIILKGFKDELAEDKMTKAQAEKLADKLQDSIHEHANYRIKRVSSDGDQHKVSLSVTGIDLTSAYLMAMDDLFAAVKQNPEQAQKDINQLLTKTLDDLPENVSYAGTAYEPVDISLKLENKDGKWLVDQQGQTTIEEIYNAFLLGVPTWQQVSDDLAAGLTTAFNEADGNLDKIFGDTAGSEAESSETVEAKPGRFENDTLYLSNLTLKILDYQYVKGEDGKTSLVVSYELDNKEGDGYTANEAFQSYVSAYQAFDTEDEVELSVAEYKGKDKNLESIKKGDTTLKKGDKVTAMINYGPIDATQDVDLFFFDDTSDDSLDYITLTAKSETTI